MTAGPGPVEALLCGTAIVHFLSPHPPARLIYYMDMLLFLHVGPIKTAQFHKQKRGSTVAQWIALQPCSAGVLGSNPTKANISKEFNMKVVVATCTCLFLVRLAVFQKSNSCYIRANISACQNFKSLTFSRSIKGMQKHSSRILISNHHFKTLNRRCSDTDNDPDRCSVAVWSLESCHTDRSPATNDAGNQGKHRVTKRRAALSNPMFTLVTMLKVKKNKHYILTYRCLSSSAALCFSALLLYCLGAGKQSGDVTALLSGSQTVQEESRAQRWRTDSG
ncbi:unnamed protein product, partial [Ranitomeya imitator]